MSTPATPDKQFVYHIDCNDIVVYCDAAWFRFARANGAPELDAPSVIGQSVWDFVATTETQALYRQLMGRARGEHTPITVSFRCDTPTCRRVMRLRIVPLEQGRLAFTSVIEIEEERPYVALLDPNAPRSETYVKMCSWCKQVLVEGSGWMEVEEAAEALQLFHQRRLPQITHAICEPCYAGVIAALE